LAGSCGSWIASSSMRSGFSRRRAITSAAGAAHLQLVLGDQRGLVQRQRLGEERADAARHLLERRQLEHAVQDELRHLHLERRVRRRRPRREAEGALAPGEAVEELPREALLQQLVELAGVDAAALEQHLAERHLARERLAQRDGELVVG
jgi:hypothetical protein